MKFYWGLRSIPELADLPPRERGRMWRRHSLSVYRTWRGLAAVFVIACTTFGALVLASFIDHAVAFIVIVPLMSGLGGIVGSQLLVEGVRPRLRSAREVQS